MNIEKKGGGVTATLFGQDDIFTLLRSRDPDLRGYRRSLTSIKEANPDVMDRRKLPWWVLPPDELVLEEDAADGRKAQAEPGWRHHYRLHGVPQVVDVYMGFMDEEVNARLARLVSEEKGMDERAQRPVILVERKKVEPKKPLLEWQLGNYEAEIKRIVSVSPAGEMLFPMEEVPSGFFGRKRKQKKVPVSPEPGKKDGDAEDASPEMILARFMALTLEQDLASDLDWLDRGLKVRRYADVIKLLQHQLKYKEGKKMARPRVALPEVGSEDTTSGPWLSIVRFAVGNDQRAPIVVIRTPEMGLQPGLMCPYLAFLFKALSGLASQLAFEAERRPAQDVSEAGAREVRSRKDQEDDSGQEVHRLEKRQWDVWEWPLRVAVFGAHGSSRADLPPGTTVTVVASLFVGAEIDSTVTVAAEEKVGTFRKEERRIVYEGTPDSGEDRPHWGVKERMEAPPPDQKRRKFKKVRVDKIEGKVFSVISLCTPAGVYEFHREEFDPEGCSHLQKIDLATEDAKRRFREEALELTLKRGEPNPDSPFEACEQELTEGTTLPDAILALKRGYGPDYFEDAEPEGIVTLTGAYFLGDDDKTMADKLGISGVNMEDYHVLRVLRSAVCQGGDLASDYPMVLDWRIDRINCDPKKIEGAVERLFKDWIRDEATLSLEDYVDVIRWGLGGVLELETPECAYWSLVDAIARQGGDAVTQHGRELLLTHLYSSAANAFVPEEGSTDPVRTTYRVPNPFCIEIATDLVAELAKLDPEKKEPGGISRLRETVARKHPPKRVGKVLADVRAKARAVQAASEEGQDPTKAARDLMATVAEECGFALEDANSVQELVQLKPWEDDAGVQRSLEPIVVATSLRKEAQRNHRKLEEGELRKQVRDEVEALRRAKQPARDATERLPMEQWTSTQYVRSLERELQGRPHCRTCVSILFRARHEALAVLNGERGARQRLQETIRDWGLVGARRLKTWLRPNKWGGPIDPIVAPTLQDLDGKGFEDVPERGFDGADVDRAFYKSSNMMALQQMAGRFLWKGGDEPIPTIGMGEEA
jgi:hypothetical protein